MFRVQLFLEKAWKWDFRFYYSAVFHVEEDNRVSGKTKPSNVFCSMAYIIHGTLYLPWLHSWKWRSICTHKIWSMNMTNFVTTQKWIWLLYKRFVRNNFFHLILLSFVKLNYIIEQTLLSGTLLYLKQGPVMKLWIQQLSQLSLM